MKKGIDTVKETLGLVQALDAGRRYISYAITIDKPRDKTRETILLAKHNHPLGQCEDVNHQMAWVGALI